MKRIFVIVSLLTSALWLSAQTPWNGSRTALVPNGTVYTVSTAEELAWIAGESQLSDFTGFTVRLAADIDLGGDQPTKQKWLPIGCAAHPFNGELDGQCHVIRNLYISDQLNSAGLFAETGSQAVIHHLALSQGQIFTDGVNDVGCMVGIHRGQLHHCFNMAQILAKNGSRVGGLVGTNYGSIAYAYNTGVITQANTQVGGLVGYNQSTATLEWCYNTGYNKAVSVAGSLFGVNEAPRTSLSHVWFDQQVTRMHATGAGSQDPLLINTDYAVVKTTEMDSLFAQNSEWNLSLSGAPYPQLACFSATNASQLSVYGILLDSVSLPVERAEGVGAPTEDGFTRNSFALCTINGLSAVWTSENSDVIQILNTGRARVFRPCSNQEIILSVSLGGDIKQIYTIVKGYDVFEPGKLNGSLSVCLGEAGVTMELISPYGKAPSGGKDDEQSGEMAYRYELIRYAVSYDDNQSQVLTPIDTAHLSYWDYETWKAPTDVPGEYAFKRYVCDAKCNTDMTESAGTAYLTVREAFDPGSLYEKPDTIYGQPADTVVLSARDASGGGEQFTYQWRYAQLKVNYVTGKVDTVAKGIVRVGYDEVNTATCPVHLTQAGEYIYTRIVSEAACGESQPSDIEHRIVVYDVLQPGAITDAYQELCVPVYDAVVTESSRVSGGNGRYVYRWLCNNEPIADSNRATLDLSGFPMEEGKTYVFQRQVKDDTGLMDWQTSAGQVTLVVYSPYSAGAIQSEEHHTCQESDAAREVLLQVANQEAASGDGDFVYAWLLYRVEENDTVLVDTIRTNTAGLDYRLRLGDYHLVPPVRLNVLRTVQNSRCKSEWQQSEGAASFAIGVHLYDTLDVPVCTREMPYTGIYTYADGHTSTYTIRQDGDTVDIQDITPEGCPMDVTLIGRAVIAPEVDIQPVLSICQTDTVFHLQYTVRTGSPDRYDLSFSEAALAEGFTDIEGGELSDGAAITIPIPTRKQGSYAVTVRFYTATVGKSDCKGAAIEVPFTLDIDGYVHRKWNDVVFVDNSDKNCEPDCDEDLTFVAWQWYKNDEPIAGATGQSYYEPGGLNGYYQVVMTAADGTVYRSCRYEMRPAEALDNVLDDRLRLYPVPVTAGSLLHVEAESAGMVEWYNMEGVCCYRQALTDATGSLRVPAVGGLYLLRWIGDNRQVITRKLIVL